MNNENIVSDLVFKQLQLSLDNQQCFDCSQANPQWASVNNGIFICMNCAALHRSMGSAISFIRSISMDQWSERQLKLMALGGNQKLKDFFQNYDLNDETVQVRYNTNAASFYRQMLRSSSENVPFQEAPPSYEDGRQQLSKEAAAAADVGFEQETTLKSNNEQQNASGGMFGSAFGLLGTVAGKVTENASYVAGAVGENALYVADKAGENVTYVAGGAAENAQWAAEQAKKKAQESGIHEHLQNTGVTGAFNSVTTKATDGLSYVGNKGYEGVSAVQSHAQEGTLVGKTTEVGYNTAAQATTMLSGIGYSLFSKVQAYSGAAAPEEKKDVKKEDDDQIDSSTKPEDK